MHGGRQEARAFGLSPRLWGEKLGQVQEPEVCFEGHQTEQKTPHESPDVHRDSGSHCRGSTRRYSWIFAHVLFLKPFARFSSHRRLVFSFLHPVPEPYLRSLGVGRRVGW